MEQNDINRFDRPLDEKTDDNASSVEKGGVTQDYVVQGAPTYEFSSVDLDRVQRRLKQRHVQMIAVSRVSICLLPANSRFDAHRLRP